MICLIKKRGELILIKILKCTELDSNIREVDLIDKGCWIDMSNPTKQEIEFVVKATRCG